jgi:hypothetical protein
MKNEEEIRNCLKAWKENPVIHDPEYKDNPAKLIIELLEWVVGDRK